ncbi:hypothetical protein NDU88_004255 [Pleurodeles waltl]|uniref:Uncharacterized protein n=1 Tax=Pleurodeles waltl TaxID=8319 RepID=A0AAV7NKH5_PLEWA|nr:hypothetical protein NDU88_004255 [Pleurodeles waltl]
MVCELCSDACLVSCFRRSAYFVLDDFQILPSTPLNFCAVGLHRRSMATILRAPRVIPRWVRLVESPFSSDSRWRLPFCVRLQLQSKLALRGYYATFESAVVSSLVTGKSAICSPFEILSGGVMVVREQSRVPELPYSAAHTMPVLATPPSSVLTVKHS